MRVNLSSATRAATLLLLGLSSTSCGDRAIDSGGHDSASVAKLAGVTPHAAGTFTGRNDHVVTGGVKIVKDGGRRYLLLDDEFTLDGAPDPKVGFGKDGTYVSSTTLASLEKDKGAQVYEVPDGMDLDDLNEVYIWCDQFSVALGVAPLTR